MKLSCGKCQTLREFSGDPLKCEVCGWAIGSIKRAVETERKFIVMLGWMGLSVLIINGVIYWLTPERRKLADEYHVPRENVIIEPKPHGCDFDDAPLGNKHCHYEKEVTLDRACSDPNCQITNVYVSWRRVED